MEAHRYILILTVVTVLGMVTVLMMLIVKWMVTKQLFGTLTEMGTALGMVTNLEIVSGQSMGTLVGIVSILCSIHNYVVPMVVWTHIYCTQRLL